MISLHMQGKVVIITGASEGIGARLVESLRRRGAKLALVARNEAKLRSLASSDDLGIPCDLNQDAARVEVIDKTAKNFGRIDAVINNAGRGSYYNATGTPLDDARGVFELNFFAPFHLTQLAAPWLTQ